MDSDEDDFVFYGTPIAREEDTISRKKKAVAEASGQLRTLVPWKQEVRDEEGRRRFHGAFSGGFSAGYYNTVGSKEGWTPQTFTSSRKNRAEIKQQDILNFLDDDEKADLEGNSLETSMQFDTFGLTGAELARKQVDKEQQDRPSAIPGPVPDELVIPATESIGVKLLLKMGWRHGQSISKAHTNSLYDARREARKAFLAFSSEDASAQTSGSELDERQIQNVKELPTDKTTPVYVLNPKQDLHGLGFDPYKNAPEFREKKRSRISGSKELSYGKPFSVKDSRFGLKPAKIAPGFGIGALEELDVEDEDVYGSGYDFEDSYVREIEEPSMLAIEAKKKVDDKVDGVLPGFKVASNIDYQLQRFDPPVIPRDYQPHHKFSAPLDDNIKMTDVAPLEVPPPDDNNLKVLIEGVATLVARCGKLFEDLSKEKNQSNPLFSFLSGGNGHDYYARKLWEERQKRNDQTKQQFDEKIFPTAQKMTAERRGNILGEKPLEKTVKDTETINLQFVLSDTFTKPASFNEPLEITKPFRDDPAKQERFEQFMKEKYEGGLRSKDSGGASYMSESARARERLEFEAAADAIKNGNWKRDGTIPSFNNSNPFDLASASGLQFTPAGQEKKNEASEAEETLMKKMYPKREEFQWRPFPLLCKRFELNDPFMGKPPPPPRPRSKMDSLIFMPDSVKSTKVDESFKSSKGKSSASRWDNSEKSQEVDTQIEAEVEVENVERPVDLYKAIFSDDEGEEEDKTNVIEVEDPQKKAEVANATLSRLIAGDFLESLGKELGMEVPPELPSNPQNKPKETLNSMKEDYNPLPVNQGTPHGKPHQIEKVGRRDRSESLSLGDERSSRKRSRHYHDRRKRNDSDSDTSDSYERDRSRSKGGKKEHSREKSSSRKHSSKHHKRRSRSEKERSDSKKDRRR